MNVFTLMVLCNNLFKNEIFSLEFWDVTMLIAQVGGLGAGQATRISGYWEGVF